MSSIELGTAGLQMNLVTSVVRLAISRESAGQQARQKEKGVELNGQQSLLNLGGLTMLVKGLRR